MSGYDKRIVSRNFSRFADDYENTARLQLRVAEELIEQAGRLYGNVLDIGAGPGVVSKLSGWDVTALDISPDMCRLNLGDVVQADMENLPFLPESFNHVVASLSLQWANNPEKVFEQVYKILKSEGKFVFSTFAPDSLNDLRLAFSYLDGDSHLMEFEPAIKVFAMMKKAGFGNLVINSQKISYLYPNIIEALRSIKNIGASYGFSSNKGLRGKKYFERLENAYKAVTKTEQGVPLHWEVLYIKGEKL